MTLFQSPPGWRSQTVTPAGATAVALGTVKSHLAIESGFTDDDAIIADYLAAAELHVQEVTHRLLITQTVDIFLDYPPGGAFIALPFGRCQSVDAITYRDQNEAEQTFSAGNYFVDLSDDLGGRVWLRPSASWPTVSQVGAAFWIRATFGYGAAPSDVPAVLRQRIMQIVATSYAFRESVVMGGSITEVSASRRMLGRWIIPALP